MYSRKTLPGIMVLSAMPLATTAQQLARPSQALDQIVAQEQAEAQLFRQYATWWKRTSSICGQRAKRGQSRGNNYFLGEANLTKGLEPESLGVMGVNHKLFGGLTWGTRTPFTEELLMC